MKTILTAAICAAALAPAAAQDLPETGQVADKSKVILELSLKNALKRSYGLGPGELPRLPAAVKPGDVGWHPSFDEALAAAAESGKPALLFQLLGRLDDALC